MIRRVSCASCGAPYDKPDDDPDLSHPSCAPADPAAFEAATHGPRTYRGVLRAIHWSTCPCGVRIDEGADMWLLDTAVGRRWVHSETCPAVIGPESAHTPSAPNATVDHVVVLDDVVAEAIAAKVWDAYIGGGS